MKIKIESVSPEGISVINGYTRELSFLDVEETKRTNFADGVKDENLIISLSDICISEIEIDSLREIDFYIHVDKPVIEMMFFISTSSTFYFDGINGALEINNFHHNIFYNQSGYQNIWQSGKNQKVVTITVYPDNILKYLQSNIYNKFLKAIDKEKNAFLFDKDLVITPRMYVLLDEIIKNKQTEGLRRLHIENCIYELFFLQIEQYNNLIDRTKSTLSANLQNKIIEVKNIIDDNLSTPLSIMNLAQLVGINDYHLKKGFKELYNTTIYSYTVKKRMYKSKELLLNEELNVNEVAFLMGYNDATNFTAAFKKYYGYTPGKILKK